MSEQRAKELTAKGFAAEVKPKQEEKSLQKCFLFLMILFPMQYDLIGAFNDGKYIVPVKLEIKEFNDKENVLYVAVALEKVKATEVSGQGNTNNGVTQNSRSVANISLAQLFRRINPNDKEFAKYIPDEFLVNKTNRSKSADTF